MPRPGIIGLGITMAIMLLTSFRLPALEVFLRPEVARDGDVIDLVLQYESEIPSLYALDKTPLQRDFEVIDAQSRIQRLSGHDTQRLRMQWIVKITPRHTGLFEIPSMQLGEMQSQPVWLEVVPRSLGDRRKVDVAMELDAEPAAPYVGEEVIVTMRLISNTPLNSGRISEPEVAQGRVYRSTQDRHRQMDRNGATYDVLERRISLFAEQPGKLTLGEAIFTGPLVEFPARQIIRKSRPLQLQVGETPAASSGRHWLPARRVELRLDWDVVQDRLEVGDSVGIELTITAHGLPAEVLPTNLLNLEQPDFRIYPDEARFSDDFVGGSIVGRLRQSFVFVAARAGNIEVPAIELPWWDTQANDWRRIKLPGRRVRVHEAVLPDMQSDSWRRLLSEERSATTHKPVVYTAWLTALAAIVLLLSIAFKLRIGRELLAKLRRHRQLRTLQRSFRDACLRDDPHAARSSLLAWARRRWPRESLHGLTAIRQQLGEPDLAAELAKLDAVLYAGSQARWRGAPLWQRFQAGIGSGTTAGPRQSTALPRLYPAAIRSRSGSSP